MNRGRKTAIIVVAAVATLLLAFEILAITITPCAPPLEGPAKSSSFSLVNQC
jgi:hypothetical protein